MLLVESFQTELLTALNRFRDIATRNRKREIYELESTATKRNLNLI